MEQRLRPVCRLFAALLDYPVPGLSGLAAECALAVSPINQAAAERLAAFAALIEQAGLIRLEEHYTAAFDLRPVGFPYLGYHLFGEGPGWGAFLVELKERYRRHGFQVAPAGELPDHLPVVLRFLAGLEDEVLGRELLEDGLLPVLERLAGGFAEGGNPYGDIVRALLLVLKTDRQAAGALS